MSTFKSWSKLFVLVLIVFVFAGCGGGGGSSTSGTTSDMSGWDTDTNHNNSTPAPTTPEPTTPEPVTPEPSNPEPVQPEPTPAPNTPEPNTGDTYTDTYDIASVLNGEWYEVSGSGTATGAHGTYHLFLLSLNATFTGTQITSNTGVTYNVTRQFWDCPEDPDYGYFFIRDNAELNLIHTGSNTWKHIASDGTIITFRFISNSTAMITHESSVNMYGNTYQVLLNYTIQKKGYGDIRDIYNIPSVMNGEWYGVDGYGYATGADGQYSVIMSSLNLNIVDTQVTNNTLTAYTTHRQYWNCYNQSGQFVTRVVLYGDNSNLNMTHIGVNIWEAQNTDGSFLRMKFTSETTAMITEETTQNIRGRDYRYYVIGTVQKRSY